MNLPCAQALCCTNLPAITLTADPNKFIRIGGACQEVEVPEWLAALVPSGLAVRLPTPRGSHMASLLPALDSPEVRSTRGLEAPRLPSPDRWPVGRTSSVRAHPRVCGRLPVAPPFSPQSTFSLRSLAVPSHLFASPPFPLYAPQQRRPDSTPLQVCVAPPSHRLSKPRERKSSVHLIAILICPEQVSGRPEYLRGRLNSHGSPSRSPPPLLLALWHAFATRANLPGQESQHSE